MTTKIEEMFNHQCKLASFYRFDSCSITTCKNYSSILDSKCLLIERKECLNNDKGMSDQELKYFKNYSDIKQLIKTKKKVFDSVYALLIFDKYLEYCKTLPQKEFSLELYNNKRLKRVTSNYPFNLKEFNLSLSSLYYIFKKSTYNSFSIGTDCKMCNEYDLTDILGLNSTTLTKLTEIFETLLETQNGSS